MLLHIYVLHIPPLIPFSIINIISISLKHSNSISAFLNKLAMLIQVLIKNELDQGHISQYIYFESFQIHLQVIVIYTKIFCINFFPYFLA